MLDTIQHYKQKYGLSVSCDGYIIRFEPLTIYKNIQGVIEMKRLLFLLFASLLVLAACGNEEKKEEHKKEKQSSEVKKKSEDSKSDKESKKDTKKETSNEEANSQDIETQQYNDASTEESSFNRLLTKEEISQKFKNGQNVNGMVDADGDTWYQAPGNGDVVGYTKSDGTQCTVGGCTTPQELENMKNDIDRTPEEQRAHKNWVNDQVEWVNASETEKEAIRKRDAEKYGYEYNPEDYE